MAVAASVRVYASLAAHHRQSVERLLTVGLEVPLDVGLGQDNPPAGVRECDPPLGDQAPDEALSEYTGVGLDGLRNREVPAATHEGLRVL